MERKPSGIYGPTVVRRYQDAYTVARVINGVGIFIRICGFVLAACTLLVSLVVWHRMGQDEQVSLGERFDDQVVLLVGVSSSILFALAPYVVSIFICAGGQILKAALDTAVNTSPFLDDKQRADIMSL